jgi:lauroyl/myristoyl acyltransferase
VRDGKDGITEGSNLWVKRRRLVRGADLRAAFLIGLSALTVKTLPADKWTSVTDQIHRMERGERSRRFRRFRNRVAAFYGPEVDDDFVRDLWRGYRTARHRRRLHVVAEKIDSGYRPSIQFAGGEHIDRAVAAGNGVILWYDNFRHHPLIGKRAVAEAGHFGLHLTSVDHGFSSSVLGRRILNPIQSSAESAYVAEKVFFDGASALAATRKVSEHLRQNGVALITNNGYIGRKVLQVPIGVSAWIKIATTPLNLSWRTSAPLLPVAVIEHRAFREYSVTVGAPLAVDGDNKDAAFRLAARRYAEYLEPIVRAHPEQWIMWTGPIEQPPPSDLDAAG